ncbi:hypothetical protein [Lysinibacillus telephonicus]|uniref:hypothetical protein n=1 Tax=Lysinibacillus telephonicus TaxID=1714840 RepID=UPI000F828EEE|nr:hypothetical protein [Lysinibacillus telephonicus]
MIQSSGMYLNYIENVELIEYEFYLLSIKSFIIQQGIFEPFVEEIKQPKKEKFYLLFTLKLLKREVLIQYGY